MAEGQTRDRIIGAARHLFSQKGFNGATTAEIAGKAEVAEGTIYTYFSSKKALLMECVSPLLEEMLNDFEEHIPESDSFRGLAVFSVEMRLRLYEKHHETIRIMLNELPYSAEMVDLFVSFLQKQSQEVARYLAKAEKMEQIVRSRNYWLFGLGHVMSLWFYVNFMKMKEETGLNLDYPFINISEEHLAADLADYFLYGIMGRPKKE